MGTKRLRAGMEEWRGVMGGSEAGRQGGRERRNTTMPI